MPMVGTASGSSANHREPFATFENPSPLTRHLRKAFRINAMPIIMPNRCWRRRQFAGSFRIDNINIFWCELNTELIKYIVMVPKKRFGVKYTRQPAPEHSSSDEGINPYLPYQAEKKTMKTILLRLLKAAMTRACMSSISAWIWNWNARWRALTSMVSH